MGILENFLRSKGVASPSELDNEPTTDGSPTELDIFNKYKDALSKEELSTENIKNFLTRQIAIIEMRWKDYSLENNKKAELIPYHTVYKTLEQAIGAPKAEREQLENQLNNLIK